MKSGPVFPICYKNNKFTKVVLKLLEILISSTSFQEQRVEVFNSAVRSKVEVDLRTFDHVDAVALMSQMEGYVARDVVTVVERAIHAGCSREMVEGRPRLDPTPHERPGNDLILCCYHHQGM